MSEKREQILLHSLQLFAQQGYASTSMRDIAQASGYSLGLAYRFWPSKEELLNTLLQSSLEALAHSLPPQLPSMQALVQHLVHSLQAHTLHWQLLLQVRCTPSLQGPMQAQLQQFDELLNDRSRHPLAQQIAGEVDAANQGHLFWLVVVGALHYALASPHYPLQQVLGAYLQRAGLH